MAEKHKYRQDWDAPIAKGKVLVDFGRLNIHNILSFTCAMLLFSTRS